MITAENGTELTQFRFIEQATGVRFYFATPYRVWGRAINENANHLIREYEPKGTSITGLTQRDCTRIARQLNCRPESASAIAPRRTAMQSNPDCWTTKLISQADPPESGTPTPRVWPPSSDPGQIAGVPN